MADKCFGSSTGVSTGSSKITAPKAKIFVPTFAAEAAAVAEKWQVGLEINEFSTGSNLEMPERAHWLAVMEEKMAHAKRFIFHAPFGELTPAPLDPLIREITYKRLQAAWEIAFAHGIDTMVVHSGYIPGIYYPQWYREKAAGFWQEFLADKPDNCLILVENVLEDDPLPLAESIRLTADPRCRICLDIGHAGIRAAGGDIIDFVQELLPYVAHVHLHDNHGQKDEHLPPGSGSLPIEEILALTEQVGPTYTLETENLTAALQWMENKGFVL